ncbi:hypothetical protein KAOT1_09296 [Kordia algicida OT-1]|uniref:Uncharacterized protein n=1 Tax=Kordia algicida OT-1 TaxID=391587 RepID=A9E3R1_9FLAO|nr:hypothetical protein KAOT1_09296 [Kordia algicida OT-1]
MKKQKLTTKSLSFKKRKISNLNHNNINGGGTSGFDNCNSFNTCYVCDSNSLGNVCGTGTHSHMCTPATCDTGTCMCDVATA